MDLSTQVPEVEWRPSSTCQLCRIGQLTVPCAVDDVRRLPASYYEPGNNYSVTQHYDDRFPPEKLYRQHVVMGEGPVPCPIMLIGEAPGFQEDREGRPFVATAPAGRMLAAAMSEAGLVRSIDVYITNAVKCRPEDNKLDRFPDGLEMCRTTFLEKEIEAVQPKVIVCLGKTAALPWFGKQGSLAFRDTAERLYIHAPHPSYVARTGQTSSPAYAQLVEALTVAKRVGYPRSEAR